MGFVADIIEGVGDAVGDVVEFVGDAISDVGSAVDDLVHDIIPGGWAGVGAGALLALGIYNPGLLGLASEGALTSEALGAAGLDAAAVAEGAAAVAPEVAAAAEAAAATGVSPEIIAMANATSDPIAALNALQGWTTADTAYLSSIGAAPEIIAAAEANNTLLASGAGSTGGAVSPEAVASTTPGPAPIVEAGPGVPGVNNPYGAGDIPLTTALGDLAGAVGETLGPAGLLGAGALGAGLLSGAFTPVSKGGTGYGPITYTPPTTEPGQVRVPVTDVGVSPGFINPTPMYQPTSDVGSQFYWGRHPYMAVAEDLPFYNQVPSAPVEPWGIAQGPAPLDVNAFIRQTINPQWQAALAGSSPALYAPQAGEASIGAKV